MSSVPYVGGLATIGLFGYSQVFSVAYGWSNNDWSTVAKAHAAGAVVALTYWAGGAAASGYTNAITATSAGAGIYVSAGAVYITQSAAIGFASTFTMAKIYGASNDDAFSAAKSGAFKSARTAFFDSISLAMRVYELDRSPSISGESDGIRGIHGKGGGCRGCDRKGFWNRLLNFGGDQSGSGELFFIPYSRGSLGDKLVESFAGAHDFFNDMIGWYDKSGNTIDGGFLREVGSVINVAPALPLAAATFRQEFGMGPLQVSNGIISDSFR